MIASRAVGLLRIVSRHPNNRLFLPNLSQLRNSGGHAADEWHYRTMQTPPKWASRMATGCAVFVWWWFYWNLYHGWPHLIGMVDGEFLPDPKTYTDEELGIPPDDEGL